MSDPRNVAHDKKVAQEKKHHGIEAGPNGSDPAEPGKKAKKNKHPEAEAETPDAAATSESAAAESSLPSHGSAPKEPPPELEGSLVVLAQLKDLAFHANAHQGRLAEMMLTVEDKLKQKELAATMGDLYALQAELHDKLNDFVTKYSAECDRLQLGGD